MLSVLQSVIMVCGCPLLLCSISLVHRIGRTGRCGKTGIATTFINKMCGKCIVYIIYIYI